MARCREVAAGSKATLGGSLAGSEPVPDEHDESTDPAASRSHSTRYVTSERFNSGKSDQEAVIPTMPEFVASISYGRMRAHGSGAWAPARARTQQQRPPRDTAGSIIDS